MKTDKLTEIGCLLRDCFYYESPAAQPDKALCSHHDAHRYLHADPPCPLYRLDWQKKLAEAKKTAKPSAGRRF